MNALNAVIQLPGGGDLLAVGYTSNSGSVASRAMYRFQLSLTPSSNQEIWGGVSNFGDSTDNHGAWEMIDFNHDQTTVLLAGVCNRPNTAEMWFKSYGNVPTGNAVLMEIPISALSSSMDPQAVATFTKVYTETAYVTSKAFRSLPNGGAVALIYGEADGAILQVFDTAANNRASVWGPTAYGYQGSGESDSIEGTDIVVSSDGLYVAISGHGSIPSVADALYGRIRKVRLSDGSLMWSGNYASCDPAANANCKFIKNECWGLQPTSDGGFVLACGTGIENCNGMSGDFLSKCQGEQGVPADPRPGAYARPPAVWQSFVVRVDSTGSMVWQRA